MFDLRWQDDAACKDTGTESWYVADERSHTTDTQILKRICSSCPVLTECREHAITYEKWGYWGGMTARDRELIRRHIGVVVQDSAA